MRVWRWRLVVWRYIKTVQIFSRDDEQDGTTVISVSGDLDIAALPSVRSAVDRALLEGASALIVDLGDVDSIDSSGLELLSGLQRQCQKSSTRCALAVTNPLVRGFLADNNSGSTLVLHPSLSAARSALGAEAR